MKILIIVAMEAELHGFIDKLNTETKLISGINVYYTKYNNVDLYIAKSNVGKVNAAMLTTTLILKLKPQYVINAGIAGALNKNIDILSVVASTKVYQHDMDLTLFGYQKGEFDDHTKYFSGSRKLLSLLDDDIVKGQMVSGDQFVSTKEQLTTIQNNFKKALTCDMEGGAIAQVCHYMSRKFLIIRAVSDNVFMESQDKIYFDNKPKAIKLAVDKTLHLLDRL